MSVLTPENCLQALRIAESYFSKTMHDETMSGGGPPNPNAVEWTEAQAEEATRLIAKVASLSTDYLADNGLIPSNDPLGDVLAALVGER